MGNFITEAMDNEKREKESIQAQKEKEEKSVINQNECKVNDSNKPDYEDFKFLYEKAIEGRNVHLQNFNHWMNMYAIFNGALFVALYSLQKDNSNYTVLNLLIMLIGCTAGWAWHFSAKGFYDWILSWIKVVKKHEKKLDRSDKNKSVVYRAYYGKRTTSTQKVTICFTKLVAIAWTVLAAVDISNFLVQTKSICINSKIILIIINFTIITLFAKILCIHTLEKKFETEEIS